MSWHFWRIPPYEYGESRSQDWIYAVKLVYKNMLQERRWDTCQFLTVTGVLVSAERNTWSASWPASSAAWAATWGSSSGCQSWTLSSLASGSSDSFSELQGSKLEFLEIEDLCNTIKAVYIENLSFPGICLLYLSILWEHSSPSPQQPRAAWPILHKHNIKLCTT